MKIIHYRNSDGIYQKGFFISLGFSLRFLVFLVYFGFYKFQDLLESPVLVYSLISLVVFFVFLYFIGDDRMLDVRLDAEQLEYNGIDIEAYIRRETKMKKGKGVRPFYKNIEVIGDYEYISAVENSKELLIFNKNLQKACEKIYEGNMDYVNFEKLSRIMSYSGQKIKDLEKIAT